MKKPATTEFTYEEEQQLLQNAIERVINTSIRILKKSTDEDADMNLEDWDELKWLTTKLWNMARGRVFKARMEGENGQI